MTSSGIFGEKANWKTKNDKERKPKSSRAFLSTFFLSLFRSLSDVFFWLFVPIKNLFLRFSFWDQMTDGKHSEPWKCQFICFLLIRTKKRLKTANFFALLSLNNPKLIALQNFPRKPLLKEKTFPKNPAGLISWPSFCLYQLSFWIKTFWIKKKVFI